MLWVSRAQAEHDAFAEVLRSRGVVVHYYSDLLAQTLDIPEARGYVLDRLFDLRWHGPLAAATLRASMDGLGSAELARYLAGGITKREIAELGPVPKSIAFHSLDPDGFVLAPLPNLLYQRDTSCWIYGGVSINAMRRPARIPETISDEAIYRWHPMFADAEFDVWYHGAEAAPATVEGGDVLVIGNGAVLVGMSERTTPQAVEMLASRIGQLPDRHRHAEGQGLHAPGHPPDHGRLRRLHQVRRNGHAALLHGGARRYGQRAEGHRPPAGGHAPGHRRRA
jgi:arginine deiminase